MPTLDQSNTTGGLFLALEGTTDTVRAVSQEITIAQAGVISQVKLTFSRTNTINGNFVCEIWSDNGADKPDTLISDSPTLSGATISTSLTEYTFNFSTQPSVSVNDKVHIVGRLDTAQTSGHTVNFSASNANPYSGGVLNRLLTSTWTLLSGYDFVFKQYYDEAPATGYANLLLMGQG